MVGVQGAAAGGTLGLVWAADHVIVAEDLQINLAYARIGGSPDGGTSFLPRLVNPLRAFELFTLCPTLDAARALRWGLILPGGLPAASLGAAVDGVVARWLAVPDVSLRNFKRLLRDAQTQALAPHLAQELRASSRPAPSRPSRPRCGPSWARHDAPVLAPGLTRPGRLAYIRTMPHRAPLPHTHRAAPASGG